MRHKANNKTKRRARRKPRPKRKNNYKKNGKRGGSVQTLSDRALRPPQGRGYAALQLTNGKRHIHFKDCKIGLALKK